MFLLATQCCPLSWASLSGHPQVCTECLQTGMQEHKATVCWAAVVGFQWEGWWHPVQFSLAQQRLIIQQMPFSMSSSLQFSQQENTKVRDADTPLGCFRRKWSCYSSGCCWMVFRHCKVLHKVSSPGEQQKQDFTGTDFSYVQLSVQYSGSRT